MRVLLLADTHLGKGQAARLVDKMRGSPKGVRIQGVDGLMVRYAQCCQPVPGDPVVGYVTRGRGVSIHRADCPNLLMLDLEPERRLDIDWKELEGERFMVRLVLDATDRRMMAIDHHLTTTNDELAREIEALREDK